MKCAVAGATGFVGSELCRQLAARDIEVLAASRELIAPASLSGVHTLFHCAGVARREASAYRHKQGNYEHVLAQAAAADAAGAERFVFLSTVRAGPEGDAYGYWKWRAEQALAERCGGGDMSVVILRPAPVYGVGAKAGLRRFVRAVRLGLPAPPAIGERSLVGLRDLCDAMCRLPGAELPGCRRFAVTDGETYTPRRIHAAIRAGLGRPAGRAWTPAWAWRLACGLAALSGRPHTWQRLFGRELHSNRALCEALNWRPVQTLEDLAPAMVAEIV